MFTSHKGRALLCYYQVNRDSTGMILYIEQLKTNLLNNNYELIDFYIDI